MEGIISVPYICIMFHNQNKNNMEKNVIVFADKYQGIDWYYSFDLGFVHQDKADLTDKNYWIEGNEIPDYVKETALSEFGCSEFVVEKSLAIEAFEIFGIEN